MLKNTKTAKTLGPTHLFYNFLFETHLMRRLLLYNVTEYDEPFSICLI